MTIIANTRLLNVRSAINFYNPIKDDAQHTYYVFAARSLPWADDLIAPDITEDVQKTDYQIYDEMVFGKKVTSSDISLMAKRNDWTSGIVYFPYDDQNEDLYSEQFFVLTSESGAWNVWKCISNAGGVPSTTQPLFSESGATADHYQTSDGYVWKFMYSYSNVTHQKFATSALLPVFQDSTVKAAAANGSIDSIVVETAGINYASFTNGHFEEIAVGGNTQIYAIGSPTVLMLNTSNTTGTFSLNETLSQAGSNATGTVVFASNTHIDLNNINGQFVANAVLTGLTSNAHATVTGITTTDVSANNDFYNQCSIYIASGTGAGQSRIIQSYYISGTQYRIFIDSAFSPAPDATSRYEIAPQVKILGDGTGAKAIAVVNAIAQSIQKIEIINRGLNYSYANVSIIGNTGIVSQTTANTASVRAIISPKGGHGYDTFSELGATRVCFSTTFANSEVGTIPTSNAYRRIGILESPKVRKLTFSVAANATFTIGEQVYQSVYSNNYPTSYGTVSSSNTTVCVLTGVVNKFDSTKQLKGANSGVSANISSISGQNSTFDQRTRLVCQYSPGSANVVVGDYLKQDTPGLDGAFGYLHSIDNLGSNNYSINLIDVKGQFEATDISGSKYIQSESGDKILVVSSVTNPDLIPYSGSIVYAENILPVSRSNTQSETFKTILDFY